MSLYGTFQVLYESYTLIVLFCILEYYNTVLFNRIVDGIESESTRYDIVYFSWYSGIVELILNSM
jgi:hypothetical protein